MEMYVQPEIQHAKLQPNACPTDSGTDYSFSPQLSGHFDRDTRALWSRWIAEPRPCFNPSLLAETRGYYGFISDSHGILACDGETLPIEYVILASGMPGVFNLGGDLDLFKQLIATEDRAGLQRYGRACIDVLYRN